MFRFTIRDVLWLTVLVAVAVGWWIDRDRLSRTLDKAHDDYVATVAHLEKLKMEMDRGDWVFRKAQSEYYQRQSEAARPAMPSRP